MRSFGLALLIATAFLGAAAAGPAPYFRYGTGTNVGASAPDAGANNPTPSVSALRIVSPQDASSRPSGVGSTNTFIAEATGFSGEVSWSSQAPGEASEPWPDWASVSPSGTVTLKPSAPGVSTLKLYATDAATKAVRMVSFTVQATNAFTVQQNDKLFRAAGIFQYTDQPVAVKNVGSVTWSVSGKPDWMTVFDSTNGLMGGTVPTGEMPDATVLLTGRDEATGQMASTSFKVRVGTPLGVAYPGVTANRPLVGSGILFGTAGVPMSLAPNVTGAKGQLSWKPNVGDFAMPAGLSLDPSTGTISGSPLKASIVSGSKNPALNYYFFHVFATDIDGATISYGFSNLIGSAIRSARLNGAPYDMTPLSDGITGTSATVPANATLELVSETAVNSIMLHYKGSAEPCYSWSTDGATWSKPSCQGAYGYNRFGDGTDLFMVSSQGTGGAGAYRYHRIVSAIPMNLVDLSLVQN